MTQSIDWAALKAPFPAEDIEWRVQQAGFTRGGKGGPYVMVLAYVTARAIMDRLDSVAGPANWTNSYISGPDGGVICRLAIRVDGEWIYKEDGAANTDIEKVKGGISGALKRAGVCWGIGRYLYDLDTGWAIIGGDGPSVKCMDYAAKQSKGKTGRTEWVKWTPPRLPDWALPAGGNKPRQQPKPAKAAPQAPATAPQKPATSGTITDNQRALLLKVLKSHVVTDSERSKMMAALDRGITREQASSSIDNLMSHVHARKAAEKAAMDAWENSSEPTGVEQEKLKVVRKPGVDPGELLEELKAKYGEPVPF